MATPVRVSIPLSAFSGEVQGGILGNPKGQVFFSPSLLGPAPNSTIEVDAVSACVQAFDTYTIPPTPPVPSAAPYTYTTFCTFGGTPCVTNDEHFVTWAPPHHLVETRSTLAYTNTETVQAAVDSRCLATLRAAYDPAKVSLTNETVPRVFDGVNPNFIVANNLAPIGPGPVTNITLQP